MKNFIFILGGIKSGKSKFAVSLAKKLKRRTVFIATGKACDKEMKEKICKHKKLRPKSWKVIEEGTNLISLLPKLKKYQVILIDCLSFWIANLLEKGLKDKEIQKQIKQLAKEIKNLRVVLILVSNDVGSSLVSENKLGRRFQNLVGYANQIMAESADEVFYLQAGIALKIKDKI